MATRDNNLDFLLELALDRSVEGRQRLAAEIGDLCSSHEHVLTEQERDLILEILKKLLAEFELPIRAMLSERLAQSSSAPRELVITLANDEIEVARPVLMESDLLRDPDLIEIIRNRGRQHQISIARRRDVSEPVSEALTETDDEDVIKTLLENPNARIAEATMAYLVEESKRVDSFQEPLVNRLDLPQDLAKKLYWWAAAALRQKILEDFDIDPTELDDALEGSAGEATEADESAAQDKASSAATQLAKRLGEEHAITPETLIKVLRKGETSLFEALFSELSGVAPPRIQRLIYDSGGEGVTIICRALEIPKQTFATIFMLSRSAGRAMSPKDLARASRIFDQVNVENAQRVLDTWRRDTDYQDAIEGLASSRLKRGA